MKYVCIHGHFYQPPRENPWLESIELQDSAAPYHDWNERIAVECYGANAASRVLDGRGRIEQIVNNYARTSFNFGPTLLAWLEEHRPRVHDAIVRADELSRQRFSGHGSALAQVYNHMIMPLANARDQRTQIIWGLRDFERRFGRSAEGIWLAETAVDSETLGLLAEQGVKFTVLAPHQAARCRPLEGSTWQDVAGGRIDPTRAYVQRLPGGESIELMFYDGPISRAIAFERLLERGEALAGRLTEAFYEGRDWPQLVHIATDGETYGHHHRHGEMALSYALKHIEDHNLAELTIYGEYLEAHPPSWEVEIAEQTSWSCAHGVERWRSDCGCHTGGDPSWDQAWRAPLRDALDWLRDELAPRFEGAAGELLEDPWAARDDYIEVLLGRGDEETLRAYLGRHAASELGEDARVQALELLEMQRHAMLMYTSCGWFFNDLAGIETIQILEYAARALQLARRALGVDLEEGFLERLARAESNTDAGDGRQIYEEQVRPAMLELRDVCAHHAIQSLFEHSADHTHIHCYEVDHLRRRVHDAGGARMALGRARIRSRTTGRAEIFEYGVLHMGDHNVDGGIRTVDPDASIEPVYAAAVEAFERAEVPALIRLLDAEFGEETFSLRSLFRDEQRRVIAHITSSARRDAEAVYQQVYERHAPLLSFLRDLGTPAPPELLVAARVALRAELGRLLTDWQEEAPRAELHAMLKEADNVGIELDWDELGHVAHDRLVEVVDIWRAAPEELSALKRLAAALELVALVPTHVSLWEAQNGYVEAIRETWPAQRERARQGDERAEAWVELFGELSAPLAVSPSAFDELEPPPLP